MGGRVFSLQLKIHIASEESATVSIKHETLGALET